MKNLSNILTRNGQEFLKSIKKAQNNMKNNLSKINCYHENKKDEKGFNPISYFISMLSFNLWFAQNGIDSVSYVVKGKSDTFISGTRTIGEFEKDGNMYGVCPLLDDMNLSEENATVELSAFSQGEEIYKENIECPYIKFFINSIDVYRNDPNGKVIVEMIFNGFEHIDIIVENTKNGERYSKSKDLDASVESSEFDFAINNLDNNDYLLKVIAIGTDTNGNLYKTVRMSNE